MSRFYASIDDARRAFDAFAGLEPRLRSLWELCRRAAPSARGVELIDDAYDVDLFDADVIAADSPVDRWCAEDYFLRNVKSELSALVGAYRVGGPRELQSAEAYETVYDLLINWALDCQCAGCIDHDDYLPLRAAGVSCTHP